MVGRLVADIGDMQTTAGRWDAAGRSIASSLPPWVPTWLGSASVAGAFDVATRVRFIGVTSVADSYAALTSAVRAGVADLIAADEGLAVVR